MLDVRCHASGNDEPSLRDGTSAGALCHPESVMCTQTSLHVWMFRGANVTKFFLPSTSDNHTLAWLTSRFPPALTISYRKMHFFSIFLFPTITGKLDSMETIGQKAKSQIWVLDRITHHLALGPWANPLTSLSPGFLIQNIGIKMQPLYMSPKW